MGKFFTTEATERTEIQTSCRAAVFSKAGGKMVFFVAASRDRGPETKDPFRPDPLIQQKMLFKLHVISLRDKYFISYGLGERGSDMPLLKKPNKALVAVLITATIFVTPLWVIPWCVRLNQPSEKVLCGTTLNGEEQLIGPIPIPPETKEVLIRLRGAAAITFSGRMSSMDDTGYGLRFGWNGSAGRTGSWYESPKMEMWKQTVRPLGEFRVLVNGKVRPRGVLLEVVEAARYSSDDRRISSIDDALDRLAGGEDREAQAYMDYQWRKHRNDPEMIERIAAPERQKLRCRPIVLLDGPIIVDYSAPWVGPQGDWQAFLNCTRGIRIDQDSWLTPSKRWRDSMQKEQDVSYKIKTLGRHSVQAYLKLEARAKSYDDDPIYAYAEEPTAWEQTLMGPALEFEVVDQLPEGLFNVITNPKLDAQMRDSIEIAEKYSDPRRKEPYWTIWQTKPLPVALAARQYVSIDGEEPIPLHDDDKPPRHQGLAFQAAGNEKEHERAFASFSVDSKLLRPGRHTYTFILKPWAVAALKSIDCDTYWGGEYRTEITYDYQPK